eukprot:1653221-Pyramimonas_sp.AAC.1
MAAAGRGGPQFSLEKGGAAAGGRGSVQPEGGGGGGSAKDTIGGQPPNSGGDAPSGSVDVGRDRNNAARTLKSSFEGERKKFQTVLKAAYVACANADPDTDPDSIKLLNDRRVICEHFWGERA